MMGYAVIHLNHHLIDSCEKAPSKARGATGVNGKHFRRDSQGRIEPARRIQSLERDKNLLGVDISYATSSKAMTSSTEEKGRRDPSS
ncbi:UNVERIFIED_CONTAM: hypothetical protein Sangu_1996700 [Sesamum angustifolium]|uniref:Uncharacterized protein n=1 Tax=Sesamum angustifolium TaxID=2727405 RepID=A0AAW2LGL4_9LAMI